jgi:predicted small secreted protein
MKWKKMILPVQIGMAAGERSELMIDNQQITTPL